MSGGLPAASNRAHFAMQEELARLTNASTAAFFLRNADYPQGEVFHIIRPDHISSAPPGAIKRPQFPEKRQAALRMLEPCIFFAIEANRKCPLHQDPAQANPINNRPEDFLATRQQKAFYEHMLERSMVCHWHDLPPPLQSRPAASHRDGFHRETTPKDMSDVQMLDSIKEEDMLSEGSMVDTAGDCDSTWDDRSRYTGFAMSEHPLATRSR
ncbi:hypothetical protein G647_02609 [Cladophialophora carrionii CBS 160.54]|uniref:Uncharacterized protein n=1 Tax=Cladophialophora carrionii CBS 160.54 TaxID=1279043 RepID=V9DIQ9_9EURO|nr:uncharacterized protein G647_02609 [Cladophialophora carrionii CBS 160.54]ETI25832.1 hypothetical protein G647_02609 [Cladophialophora carrionii CBS 160.54]